VKMLRILGVDGGGGFWSGSVLSVCVQTFYKVSNICINKEVVIPFGI